MGNFTVFLDLDGVIADFDGRTLEMLGHEPDREEVRQCMRTPHFFRDLKPLPGALEAVAELEALIPGQLRILSAVPSSDPDLEDVARTEKIAWVQQYLPKLAHNALIVKSKANITTNKESYLLDDHGDWNGASDFGGTLVDFRGPSDWQKLIAIVKKKVADPTLGIIKTSNLWTKYT